MNKPQTAFGGMPPLEVFKY
ncbi:hypothetical protein [Pseudomonas sp.]